MEVNEKTSLTGNILFLKMESVPLCSLPDVPLELWVDSMMLVSLDVMGVSVVYVARCCRFC